jgi:cytidylate kinase
VVIAIDGPGGVGKSTVSQRVATLLGFVHLDTGSTYRAATLAAVRGGIDAADAAAVTAAVDASIIDYDEQRILLDGHDVSAEVRSAEVTAAVSAVSAIPAVRSRIVAMQRKWVADRGGEAVVEGRDIGTVVFPDAGLKVYLTATPEVRAARRAGDAEAGSLDVDAIAADLRRRDHLDSSREVAPLRPAEDAHIVDTSELSLDQVVAAVLRLYELADR